MKVHVYWWKVTSHIRQFFPLLPLRLSGAKGPFSQMSEEAARRTEECKLNAAWKSVSFRFFWSEMRAVEKIEFLVVPFFSRIWDSDPDEIAVLQSGIVALNKNKLPLKPRFL